MGTIFRIKDSRISLSFRCFIPKTERAVTVPSSLTPIVHTSPPTTSNINKTDNIESTPIARPQNEKAQISKKNISDEFSPVPVNKEQATAPPLPKNDVGYLPYHDHVDSNPTLFSGFSSTNNGQSKTDEKLCLIFGTSITTGIDGKKMSRRSRTVVNCSYSGAKISDIHKVAEDFFAENPQSVQNVDKIIISVGTNEVTYFNSDKYCISSRYRTPLVNLVKAIKFMFPFAQIIFQSVLPVRRFYTYTAQSVHLFNKLLIDICYTYGCVFMDCFGRFLDQFQFDYDTNLYRDNLHLNDFGLSKLCQAYKYVIYCNVFNPLARYSYFPRYYNM